MMLFPYIFRKSQEKLYQTIETILEKISLQVWKSEKIFDKDFGFISIQC